MTGLEMAQVPGEPTWGGGTDRQGHYWSRHPDGRWCSIDMRPRYWAALWLRYGPIRRAG